MSFNTSTVLAFVSDTGAGFSTTGVGSDSIDSGTWSLQKSPTATIVSESQSEPFALNHLQVHINPVPSAYVLPFYQDVRQ